MKNEIHPANEEKVLKYIDMPLQHCDGAVLKRMNRKYDINRYRELIKALGLRT